MLSYKKFSLLVDDTWQFDLQFRFDERTVLNYHLNPDFLDSLETGRLHLFLGIFVNVTRGYNQSGERFIRFTDELFNKTIELKRRKSIEPGEVRFWA